MLRAPLRSVVAFLAALAVAQAASSGAAAHGGTTVGSYELEVAWRSEPAIAGEGNAVQVSITDTTTLQPVTGLNAGSLSVAISPVGQSGSPQPLAATAVAGTYEAAFVPAVAADYTFRVTGSINGTPVDFAVQNFVDPPAVQPGPAVDPIVIVGGVVILILLVGMALLLFRVRPASTGSRR